MANPNGGPVGVRKLRPEDTSRRLLTITGDLFKLAPEDCVRLLSVDVSESERTIKRWFNLQEKGSPTAPRKTETKNLVIKFLVNWIEKSTNIRPTEKDVADVIFDSDPSDDRLLSFIQTIDSARHSHFSKIYRSSILTSKKDNRAQLRAISGDWFLYREHSLARGKIIRELLVIGDPTPATALAKIYPYYVPLEDELSVNSNSKESENPPSEYTGNVYPVHMNNNEDNRRIMIVTGNIGSENLRFWTFQLQIDTSFHFTTTAGLCPALFLGLSDARGELSAGKAFLRKVRTKDTKETALPNLKLELFPNGARTNGKPREGIVRDFRADSKSVPELEIFEHYRKVLLVPSESNLLAISPEEVAKLTVK